MKDGTRLKFLRVYKTTSSVLVSCRTIAISNVQNLLRRGQLGEAVALLRAAR